MSGKKADVRQNPAHYNLLKERDLSHLCLTSCDFYDKLSYEKENHEARADRSPSQANQSGAFFSSAIHR